MRKFSDRHIGVPDLDEKSMKDYLGVESLEQLIQETIPDEIRSNKNLNLDSAISESQYSNHIYQLSQKNKYFKNSGEALVVSIPMNVTCNPRVLAGSIRCLLLSMMVLPFLPGVKVSSFTPTKIVISFKPIL